MAQIPPFPGVRFREHPTRKHGVKADRYFTIRHQVGGVRHEEILSWASQRMTAHKALLILAELREAARTARGGKTTLAERRAKRSSETVEEMPCARHEDPRRGAHPLSVCRRPTGNPCTAARPARYALGSRKRPAAHRVTLSIRLLKVPALLIECVAMHELCHLMPPDRSTASCQILSACFPGRSPRRRRCGHGPWIAA